MGLIRFLPAPGGKLSRNRLAQVVQLRVNPEAYELHERDLFQQGVVYVYI